jgi:hypothetical protein
MMAGWRISYLKKTSINSPPTYVDSPFGNSFNFTVNSGGSFDYDPADPGCGVIDASNSPNYGYYDNQYAGDHEWIGPCWNFDDFSGAGCFVDTFPAIAIRAFDLSPLINDGGTLEVLKVSIFTSNPFGSSNPVHFAASLEAIVEVDYNPVDSDFWTDFSNSHEIIDGIDLEKDSLYVYVPEAVAQPYLPPSFDCYPPPPPPPPIVDPPGGGNGSGPPSGNPGGGTGDGCYYANVYQQWISCCGLPPDDPHACGTCSVQTVLVGTVLVCP